MQVLTGQEEDFGFHCECEGKITGAEEYMEDLRAQGWGRTCPPFTATEINLGAGKGVPALLL